MYASLAGDHVSSDRLAIGAAVTNPDTDLHSYTASTLPTILVKIVIVSIKHHGQKQLGRGNGLFGLHILNHIL